MPEAGAVMSHVTKGGVVVALVVAAVRVRGGAGAKSEESRRLAVNCTKDWSEA